jgi:hypothetical protein
MAIPFHKHLKNRHLQGIPSICDDLGNMDASPINLSSDFLFVTQTDQTRTS